MLKLVCLSMVVCWCATAAASASDELVALLGGARGQYRMSLCMDVAGKGGGAVCPAALWRHQWAVASASCLHGWQRYKIRALRDYDAVTCDDLARGKGESQAVRVRALFKHGSEGGPALLALEQHFPLGPVDALLEEGAGMPANASSAQALAEFEQWMWLLYNEYPLDMKKSYKHNSSLFSSPLRMFMTTVLLPSLSFVVFFMYVVFYTGSKEEVPYRSLCDKKGEDNPLTV